MKTFILINIDGVIMGLYDDKESLANAIDNLIVENKENCLYYREADMAPNLKWAYATEDSCASQEGFIDNFGINLVEKELSQDICNYLNAALKTDNIDFEVTPDSVDFTKFFVHFSHEEGGDYGKFLNDLLDIEIEIKVDRIIFS